MKPVVDCMVALLALLAAPTASAVDRLVEGFPELPVAAREVAERSLGCQHFWGEIGGTGDERCTSDSMAHGGARRLVQALTIESRDLTAHTSDDVRRRCTRSSILLSIHRVGYSVAA